MNEMRRDQEQVQNELQDAQRTGVVAAERAESLNSERAARVCMFPLFLCVF